LSIEGLILFELSVYQSQNQVIFFKTD